MIAPSPSTWEVEETFQPPSYFQNDEVAKDYAEFFDHLDFSSLPAPRSSGRGRRGHPQSAYVKALLVKTREKKTYVTELRSFLLKHPALVLLLGFRPVVSAFSPFGFHVAKTVPTVRHFRRKLQTIPNSMLQTILAGTVRDLKAEVPHLGRRTALDNKHIFAWVKQNNKKTYVKERFNPNRHPKGDPDCRLGVKEVSNQKSAQQDRAQEQEKAYLWGYGTSVVATKHRRLGEFVLAEETQPFNVRDIEFFPTLMPEAEARLGFRPKHFTADAAFDAWYVYDYFAQVGGKAYIPLNLRGHPLPRLGPNGFHLCDDNREMVGSYTYEDRTRGYQAQKEVCPILFGHLPATQTCRINHPQFQKGCGCVKYANRERGAEARLELDRSSRAFKVGYAWRTASERIFSQAKELGIERPRLRNLHSIRNQNTLIYIVINVNALQRAREAKRRKITGL